MSILNIRIGILLFFTLSLFTCENDYKNNNQNTFEESQNLNGQQITDLTKSSENNLNTKTKNIEEEENAETIEQNRWMWQKPNLIIDLLGDLTDKTVADIGAGPYGYFSFRIAFQNPKKIIAIDIDSSAIAFMNHASQFLKEHKDKFETRLVTPDDPKLKEGEADIVLIVNTYVYIENKIQYLKNLRKGISKGGKIIIVDYKMKDTPVLNVPLELKVPVNELQSDLKKAGYHKIKIDDQLLPYQYIVKAENY